MNRRAFIASAGGLASVTLAGCATVGEGAESILGTGSVEYDVGMSRMEFLPEEYEVTVGDTVVWMNTSESVHTVTATSLPDDAEYFASGGYEDYESARDAWHEYHGGEIDVRETFEHTFEVPGTYGYVCEPHVVGGMVGEIVVTE